MCAIAIALAEMGHAVSGSDLRDQPVLDRVRAAGVDGPRRPRPEHRRRVRRRHVVDGDPGQQHRARARPASSASRRCAGPACWPSICAQAHAVGVAGTHGKTTTTSMLMLILAEAGLAPSFIVGGDVTDAGTGAHWTGGEWLVVEADESDGTHLELPAPRHDPDSTSSSTSSSTTARSTASSPSFDRYLAQDRRPEGASAPTTPVLPRLAAAPRRRRRTGSAEDADVRAVDLRSPAVARSVRRRAARRTGPRAAGRRRTCRCAACTTSSTPPARSRWRSSSACRSTRCRDGAGPLRRRRPPLRHPRRRRRGDVRRRLRPPAGRDRRRHRRRPRQRRRVAAGRRRVPAQPLQPHRRDVAATTPTRSSAPTSSCSPTSTRRARRRSRASPAS